MTQPWLIVTGDFSRTGGMDRANLALAERLADRNIPVHLVCHAADPELTNRPSVIQHRVPRPGGMHFPSSFLLTRTARAVASRLGPAVVLANGGNLCWSGLNWVHYLHAAWDDRPMGWGWRSWKQRLAQGLDRRQEAAALSQARMIVCNSHRTAEQIAEHYPISDARLRVIYYGADAGRCGPIPVSERLRLRQQLSLTADQPCLLFVGALGDRRKNFDSLFAAWQRLQTEAAWRDAVLLVIGQGSQLPVWQQRAADAGLAASLRFLGFRRDVPELLAAADLLVHPARYEAFGLSPHEALCRGIPILVSAAAGVTEQLPAEWSPLLLSQPDDVADLVTRLRNWLTQQARWRQAAAALSGSVRQRSWSDMADDIIAVAEELSPVETLTLPC
jgi:glycosyltransferase involved in cell wall biosynthesis